MAQVENYQEEAKNETKTEFGIPIDYVFSKPASEEQIQRAAESLRKHGFEVVVVNSPEEARVKVKEMLPLDKTILTASSETVSLSGLDQEINSPDSPYRSIRKDLSQMDPETPFRDRIRMGAMPDVVVGSVHAITEDGQVLIASASGSQLGPYAATADKVIWIVGSQKIVPDLDTGFRRLKMYSYPLEDIGARQKYNFPSMLAKVLVVNGERPGRITIVLIRSAIGY